MKNLLNIDDKVKVVLQGEGKETVIGNGEIVTVTNIDKFPGGTIYYIGSFHVNCPEGGEGYDTTIQFKEGEYSKLDSNVSGELKEGYSMKLSIDATEIKKELAEVENQLDRIIEKQEKIAKFTAQ